MKKLKLIKLIYIFLALALNGCENTEEAEVKSDELNKAEQTVKAKSNYIVLDENLTRLKEDFNAHQGQLRLFFIVGPTCGICLRGMADLQDEFLQEMQSDPRVHTFVVHVPALDAEEKDVAPTIPLMSGPRITHYWDGVGHTGLDFKSTLDIDMYAWDVWLIYRTDATWEPSSAPPKPLFWQHQLGGLNSDKKLDKKIFGKEVRSLLANVKVTDKHKELATDFKASKLDLLPVEQPRSRMVTHNIKSRGGYRQLKTIQSISLQGETEIDGTRYPLEIVKERPNHYKRTVSRDDSMVQASWNGERIRYTHEEHLSLPKNLMEEMLRSFDIDGWMIEWKDKGHQIWRLGMKKVGKRLPWLMEAELKNGQTWHIYVDSHTGDAFRKALIDSNGSETFAMEFDDFSDVDGFRLPHSVRYYDGEKLLASDYFDSIRISASIQENEPVVSH